MRKGEIEKGRERRGRGGGSMTEEETQSCTQRKGHASSATGLTYDFTEFCVCVFFFSFLQLEVYKSVTDKRKLLRWFI